MKTFIRTHPEFTNSLETVKEMVSSLSEDKLADNYSLQSLKVDEWCAVSLYPGGFSSIIWRKYWGNNCRILNRFYKLQSHRFKNKSSVITQETLDMINQQLDVAKQLGFDCAFMSRETKKPAFHHYKKHLPHKWFTPSKKYLMVGNSYQHVMWTPINSNKFIMGD